MVVVEGRRHGDDEGIGLRGFEHGLEATHAHRTADGDGEIWLDEGHLTPLDGLDRPGVGVHPDDLDAASGQDHGRGQPDVAQSDDRYAAGEDVNHECSPSGCMAKSGGRGRARQGR